MIEYADAKRRESRDDLLLASRARDQRKYIQLRDRLDNTTNPIMRRALEVEMTELRDRITVTNGILPEHCR